MGEARGRKCFVGSDVVDGERMSVLSDLTIESNESRDDWDGDMGASSTIQKRRASYTRGGEYRPSVQGRGELRLKDAPGPRISVHLFIVLTLRLIRKK